MSTTIHNFMSPLEGAKFMARKGYKVFPLIPNSKAPAFKKWQEWATNNDKKIQEYGQQNPLSNWGVYCGPSGLTVIDIDAKEYDGYKTLSELEANYGKISETFTVKTPSNGAHLYFVGSCKSTVSQVGKAVDTRGEGGYVVAPGSVLNDRPYFIASAAEIKHLPHWVKELAEAKKPQVVLDDDLPIESGSRNQTLTRLAGVMRSRGFSHDAILAALEITNEKQINPPLPRHEIEHIAKSVARYAPENAIGATDFLTTPEGVIGRTADTINALNIPKRDWVMYGRYVGKFISVIVAPGGVGKSAITMLDAVAVATGKPLTGSEIVKPGAVWIYNTEDPMDELERRLVAVSIHHEIPLSKLSNVHITSGRDNPLIMAKNSGREGIQINEKAIEVCVDYIRKNRIELFLVDPFVRAHEVEENDNMQIDKVVQCFQRIADRTGCAVGLVHHTSKAGSNSHSGDANKARGASALISAARVAHDIATMSSDEAKKFAIADEQRSWYMRLDNAKANLQPPADRANWFQKVSVELLNGDSVGTVETVPDLVDASEARRSEKLKGDRKDISNFLIKTLRPGQSMQCSDFYELIAKDISYSHLFERVRSVKSGVIEIRKMLSTPLEVGHLQFSIVRIENKATIACELSDKHKDMGIIEARKQLTTEDFLQ